MSFNARRIVALAVVLLGSTFGGLLAVVGLVGLALVLVWANQSL